MFRATSPLAASVASESVWSARSFPNGLIVTSQLCAIALLGSTLLSLVAKVL